MAPAKVELNLDYLKTGVDVKGTVTRVESYGVFILLDDTRASMSGAPVCGMCHISGESRLPRPPPPPRLLLRVVLLSVCPILGTSVMRPQLLAVLLLLLLLVER